MNNSMVGGTEHNVNITYNPKWIVGQATTKKRAGVRVSP
jgi:hypothetical protein